MERDGIPNHQSCCCTGLDCSRQASPYPHQRVTTGQGNCYVTEATDLLELEWCVEMEQYRQLKEQFHCRLATAALKGRDICV
ncbi:unnamed protein product [Heligmosomoides polygyrus]|uniref:Uncharacterized protein n=1 Tax=Heligmosomoides polygyrus TaxID=6339 RepID=A0A183G8Y9_HELPZ|nr:unnamed protein product [Heligmosomoides polygyrus]